VSLWALPVIGQEQQVAQSGLHVIWSTPITLETVPPPEVGKPYIRPRENGISLGQSVDRDGQITFLARRSDFSSSTNVLLEDFERNGFQKMTHIQLKGTQADRPSTLLARVFGTKENAYSRDPSIGSMTVDNHNRIWVGGATDYYIGIASDPHSRAYIAQIDRTGTPVWEKSYKTGNVPFVVSITPASNGNVLVAANDGWFQSCWLALIAASDGTIVWEQHIGNGKGIAAVRAADDAFLVASFEATGTGRVYEEGVAVQRVTADGKVGPSTIVRPSINTQKGASYGSLSISSTNDGAYIVSSWEVPFEQNPTLLKPSQIARVDTEGRLLWRVTIPMSFVANQDRGGATFCNQPAVATLPNGDALVACALRGTIYTHAFNRLTGDEKQASFPLPACNDGEHPVALSLFVRSNGQVLVSGTRPGGNVGPGCSWLAHLPSSGI
jgi:hypothetical protein